MQKLINQEDVAKAIRDLTAQNKKPTLAAIHAALGQRGSLTTISRFKKEFDAAAEPVANDSSGVNHHFRLVWAAAVDEGKKQSDTLISELRENLGAFERENERLEGALLAAQNQIGEKEQLRLAVESELRDVRAQAHEEAQQGKLALAAAQAKGAEAQAEVSIVRQQLTEVQSGHAAELKEWKAELRNSEQKAQSLQDKLHVVELQLERLKGQVEARTELTEGARHLAK